MSAPGHTPRDLLAFAAALVIASPLVLMVAQLAGWVSL